MPLGTVEKIDGKFVVVSLKRQDMCGDCHACELLGETKKCELKCINICDSTVGDQVEVDVEKASFMKATLTMYGLPLVALLVGIGIGSLISEMVGLVLGLGLMATVFGVIKYREKKQKYNQMLPVATKIIKEEV